MAVHGFSRKLQYVCLVGGEIVPFHDADGDDPEEFGDIRWSRILVFGPDKSGKMHKIDTMYSDLLDYDSTDDWIYR